MEQHVSERIKFLIDSRAKGNKSAFGRAVNLTPQAVMDILEAKSGPGFASLQKILKGYPDISSDWLIFGEGEMLKGQQPEGAGLTIGLTSGAATVAEAENVLLREQVADLRQQVSRLWSLSGLMEKLGKMPSNLDAALTMIRQAFGQQAGAELSLG